MGAEPIAYASQFIDITKFDWQNLINLLIYIYNLKRVLF